MRTRRIVAIVLAFITLPFLLFGLIDPLEGGISLCVAIVLGIVVWAVARVSVPKLLWISLIGTMALGALTLSMAMLTLGAATGSGTATNPILPVVVLLWLWRIGVLVVLLGTIIYVARLIRSLREPLSTTEEVTS